MVRKKLEEDDPYELHFMNVPSSEDMHIQVMAETFIDEYLRMGWDDELILSIFRMPFYRGPYAAYELLGEESIKTMIGDIREKWKSRRAKR